MLTVTSFHARENPQARRESARAWVWPCWGGWLCLRRPAAPRRSSGWLRPDSSSPYWVYWWARLDGRSRRLGFWFDGLSSPCPARTSASSIRDPRYPSSNRLLLVRVSSYSGRDCSSSPPLPWIYRWDPMRKIFK